MVPSKRRDNIIPLNAAACFCFCSHIIMSALELISEIEFIIASVVAPKNAVLGVDDVIYLKIKIIKIITAFSLGGHEGENQQVDVGASGGKNKGGAVLYNGAFDAALGGDKSDRKVSR